MPALGFPLLHLFVEDALDAHDGGIVSIRNRLPFWFRATFYGAQHARDVPRYDFAVRVEKEKLLVAPGLAEDGSPLLVWLLARRIQH